MRARADSEAKFHEACGVETSNTFVLTDNVLEHRTRLSLGTGTQAGEFGHTHNAHDVTDSDDSSCDVSGSPWHLAAEY